MDIYFLKINVSMVVTQTLGTLKQRRNILLTVLILIHAHCASAGLGVRVY